MGQIASGRPIPNQYLNVFDLSLLIGMAGAGIAIAVLAALLPGQGRRGLESPAEVPPKVGRQSTFLGDPRRGHRTACSRWH
jgi:hypothetical protein